MTDRRSDQPGHYSAGAIALHWLTAGCFAFQIGLGWRMGATHGPQSFAVFQLHKSVGITILLLTLVRIGWRMAFRPPAYPSTMRPAEKQLAHAVHLGFYLLLLGLPLSGWMIVSSSKLAVPTLLYGTIPWPHFPGVAGLDPARRAMLNEAAAGTHISFVWLAFAAILLHVGGALKHQFHQRDYLARMTRLPVASLPAAALLVISGFVLLAALGRSLRLTPLPASSKAAPIVATRASSPPTSQASILPPPANDPAPTSPVPLVGARGGKEASPRPSAWIVRSAESSLRFHTAWSEGPVVGGFSGWRAAIRFDPDALAHSSVRVTIDMASVAVGSIEQQSALPEKDWFFISAYPIAIWRADGFRHLGGDRYSAAGTLSLRGVTRPLPLAFTLSIDRDVATMHGTAAIDRTLFGVGQGEWASTADLPALVNLSIEIKANRAKPSTTETE